MTSAFGARRQKSKAKPVQAKEKWLDPTAHNKQKHTHAHPHTHPTHTHAVSQSSKLGSPSFGFSVLLSILPNEYRVIILVLFCLQPIESWLTKGHICFREIYRECSIKEHNYFRSV